MPEETKAKEITPEREGAVFSRRLAILLSCTAGPGAGHFVQRRWLGGLLFMASFIACLVMLILEVVVPMVMNWRIALDAAEHGSWEPLRAISVLKVLGFFGLAVLIYLAALLDVIAYARRQSRCRLGKRQNNLEQND